MKRTATALVGLIALTTFLVLRGFSTLTLGAAESAERTVKITAHRFAYEPSEIRLKKGEPVVFELTSEDIEHGFNIPELGLRADVEPGETARLRIVPEKTGTYEFHCDNFCGLDHENMTGSIIVE